MSFRPVDFVLARPAALVAGLLILICVVGLTGVFRSGRQSQETLLYTNSPPGPATTVVRDPIPIVTLPPKRPATPSPLPTPAGQPSSSPGPEKKPLTGVHIHTELPANTNPPPLGVYAPAGRFLRCQTVITVDSANVDTPIVALVTDDLWHDGRLVIPAGSEVFGKANADRTRDCIIASGSWTIVWQSGEELIVSGIALDRDQSADGTRWGITDGKAGLTGQVIRSDSFAELKMFAATFMSAAASGLQESRSTVLGAVITGTARNAALSGAGQVMNTYAQQILEAIRRDGIFVRVPAGKLMYLFIPETIDRSKAKIGSLRAAELLASPFAHRASSTTTSHEN